MRERRRLVSSSEVFQEILHRYLHSDNREKIEPAFELLDGLFDELSVAVERAAPSRCQISATAGTSVLMRRFNHTTSSSAGRGLDM